MGAKMKSWERYRLKDVEAYRAKKREYAKTPAERAKRREYQRKWREKNRDRHNQLARESHQRNKHKHVERNRNRRLENDYGITTEQKLEMVAAQDGKCGICRRELVLTRGTHLDHSHYNGQIRGILCHVCNTKLAWYESFRGNIEKYLSGSCKPSYKNADDPIWCEHRVKYSQGKTKRRKI
jgi:hypothetical protein